MAQPLLLVLTNRDITIKRADKKALKAIEAATSYLVQGHRYVSAFKKHFWDGRQRMMDYVDGHYVVPIGMLGNITRALDEKKIEYSVKRRPSPPMEKIVYEWNDAIVPRKYQLEAVDAFLSKPNAGRGILKLAIRAGKTLTSSRIIWELQVRTLFVVPSQMLLKQTLDAIRNLLPGARVGQIGDGVWEPGDVTVATIQSLLAARGGREKTCRGNVMSSDEDCACGKGRCTGGRKYLTKQNKVYDSFMNSQELIIVDECFVAGTMIGDKKIEDIKIGDFVPSFDEKTMEYCEKKVVRIFKSTPHSLFKVSFSDGTFFVCTENHPVLTQRGFVPAGRLDKSSDVVFKHSHEKERLDFETLGLDNVEVLQQTSDGTFGGMCSDGFVYNLEVEETHTYVANGIAVHNCHHLTGEKWRDVIFDCPARYRLGLSATVFFDMDSEVERGVLWIRATTGDIKFDVGMSTLIEQGYLMRQNVRLYRIDKPAELLDRTSWNASITLDGIYKNEYRNNEIVKLAKQHLEEGFKNVLIATNRVEQVKCLDAVLDHYRIDHGIITGKTSKEDRITILDQFKRGEFQVLLGTVLGEGLDIPESECVINAEGGKDAKKTIQRMRSMTIMEGKTRSLMIDFYDVTNKYLRKHSNERTKVYLSEKAFIVEKMWQRASKK